MMPILQMRTRGTVISSRSETLIGEKEIKSQKFMFLEEKKNHRNSESNENKLNKHQFIEPICEKKIFLNISKKTVNQFSVFLFLLF